MEWVHPMHLRIGDMDIHPITDIVSPYVQALKTVRNLEQLQQVTLDHKVFSGDAYDAAEAMTEEDWPAWVRFNVIGRQDGADIEELMALSEQFGMIMIPEQMMHISAVTGHFGVPDGLAVIRLAEEGMLVEVDGRAVITLPNGR